MTEKPIDTTKLITQLEEIYHSSKPWDVRNKLRVYIDKIIEHTKTTTV